MSCSLSWKTVLDCKVALLELDQRADPVAFGLLADYEMSNQFISWTPFLDWDECHGLWFRVVIVGRVKKHNINQSVDFAANFKKCEWWSSLFGSLVDAMDLEDEVYVMYTFTLFSQTAKCSRKEQLDNWRLMMGSNLFQIGYQFEQKHFYT